ncbi:hypothetical protein DFH06DRAFT_1305146 [Mycena polygramma]|nr:hypothetical protein DFH06DRAFT_1305146 [Mycena polygramma]
MPISMSPQPSITQIRLHNITKCLAATATSLEVLASGLKEPSLEAISYTTQSLLKNLETIKQNKNECIQLLEQTHVLLNAILITRVKSDTGADLPPSVLTDIGKFTQTLHMVHTFVEAQQKGSRIKRLFRQGELGTLLKSCKEGLQQGLDSFQINMSKLVQDITDIQKESEIRHQEVLCLIEALSDASSDGASTLSRFYSGSHNSSTSISMLPSEPKIFHGRDTELSKILQLFEQRVPRITILGAGGMGKTTVARAVLHNTQITGRYGQHRHFVVYDSATTKVEMAALIGAHLGLKPGKDLTRAVIQHFASSPPSLLILDNLETVWELTESRNKVEEFLSLLTDVKHLALIVTMRGAERPAKVAWTHPFLPPLRPLEQDAACQIFIDIADAVHDPQEVDQILALTDNMPLAISLLANVAGSEGCSTVLSRWEEEKTSMISNGWDRKSNLDLSISLSLSSPRLRIFPHSPQLLSLLSMLPNGLSDVDLVQSKLPIDNILGCRAVLISTSLAYTDSHKRLKALVPIKEYMQKIQPPKDDLIRPLRKYFQQLLEINQKVQGTIPGSGTFARISSNLGNIQNILQKGLYQGHPDLVDCIYCACHLSRFSTLTGQSAVHLTAQIPNILPLPCDHRLEAYFAIELLSSWSFNCIGDLETVISKTATHIEQCNDSDLKCSFYITLSDIYLARKQALPDALNFGQTALSLAISAGNTKRQYQALSSIALARYSLGDYSAAQANSRECQRFARISADVYAEADGVHIEALSLCGLGDYNQSLTLCNRTRDLLASCGMLHSELDLYTINSQAEVHKFKSEYTEARDIYHQMWQETSIDQGSYTHGFVLLNIAGVEVCTDVPKDVVRKNIDAARKIFSTVSFDRGLAACDTLLADLTYVEGDMLVAKTGFLECLNFSWGIDTEITSYCLERLSDISLCDVSVKTSGWTTVLLAHSLKLRSKLLIYKALLSFGRIFHGQADEDTAMSLFNVALEGFTEMGVHRSRGECMLLLGDIHQGHGDLLKAVDLWDSARPLFERSLQSKRVKQIDERLAAVGKDLLEQHRETNFACLVELKAPSGTIEEMQDDLSDVEDLQERSVDKERSILGMV